MCACVETLMSVMDLYSGDTPGDRGNGQYEKPKDNNDNGNKFEKPKDDHDNKINNEENKEENKINENKIEEKK